MYSKEAPMNKEYSLDQFRWRVRKVFNWLGSMEYMIELDEVEGCVSFGDTMIEAKKGLNEALYLWVRKFGEQQLPEIRQGAHIIFLDPPMKEEECSYINNEIMKLKEIR